METTQRLRELLARRATAGLDEAESRELSGLLASHPEWDNDSFDRAAAALDLALADEGELPEELGRRLRDAAREFPSQGAQAETPAEGPAEGPAAEGAAGDPAVDPETPPADAPESPADGPAAAGAPPPGAEATSLRRTGMPPWSGWLAAAAALAIALFAWWPRAQTPPADAEMRSRLVDDARDLLRADWRAGDDPAIVGDVGGDVVWSSRRQRGYLLIRGLRVNDPESFQYQLWIHDAARPGPHPVDGGVFDIPRGREQVVIPVDAKLPVGRPTRFEVTVERPGGVVVSERQRVVLVAEVGDG